MTNLTNRVLGQERPVLKLEVKVLNLNEPPSHNDVEVQVFENATHGSLVAALMATDEDGELATKGTFEILSVIDEFERDRRQIFAINREDTGARLCKVSPANSWRVRLCLCEIQTQYTFPRK